MTSNIVIQNYDIMTFYFDRGIEDGYYFFNNKIRKIILLNIFDNALDNFFSDPQYGLHWTEIKRNLTENIRSLCVEPFTNFTLKKYPGFCPYNFVITYFNNERFVSKVIVDFNFERVRKLLRPYSIWKDFHDRDYIEKFNMTSYSYAEYFYDHWLDNYLQLDINIVEEKPMKEVYIQNADKKMYLSDTTIDHPFFKNIYDQRIRFQHEKGLLTIQSIKSYLEIYASQFNFNTIKDKLIDLQTNKILLLWDYSTFNFDIQHINFNNIELHVIENSIKDSSFTIEVTNFMYNINVRLHDSFLGIGNPIWSFYLINK